LLWLENKKTEEKREVQQKLRTPFNLASSCPPPVAHLLHGDSNHFSLLVASSAFSDDAMQQPPQPSNPHLNS
jgi:hypothetical protein